MARPRNAYSLHVRTHALALVATGMTSAEVEEATGVPAGTVRRWVTELPDDVRAKVAGRQVSLIPDDQLLGEYVRRAVRAGIVVASLAEGDEGERWLREAGPASAGVYADRLLSRVVRLLDRAAGALEPPRGRDLSDLSALSNEELATLERIAESVAARAAEGAPVKGRGN